MESRFQRDKNIAHVEGPSTIFVNFLGSYNFSHQAGPQVLMPDALP
jgi:hypothetical protein